MAVSNKVLAERFADGKERGKAYSMRIEGDDLYSRRTIMARRLDEDTIAVNHKKYSISTTQQQSDLHWALIAAGYEPTGEYIAPPTSGWIDGKKDYRSDEPFEVYKRANTGVRAA